MSFFMMGYTKPQDQSTTRKKLLCQCYTCLRPLLGGGEQMIYKFILLRAGIRCTRKRETDESSTRESINLPTKNMKLVSVLKMGRNMKKTLSKNNDADEKKLLPITLLENEDDVVIKHEGQSRGNRRAAKQGRHTSKFCLHPAGDTPSACRLFDSISSFCVPVIVSDGIELPFKDVIDYRKFYVFLRSDAALKPEFLVKRLRKVKPQKILKYQKAMKEVRRYFDYTHRNETMNEIWRQVTQKTPLIKLMITREKRMIKTESNEEHSCDKSEKPPPRAKFSTGTDELMMLALALSWRVVFGLGGFGVRCKHSEEEISNLMSQLYTIYIIYNNNNGKGPLLVCFALRPQSFKIFFMMGYTKTQDQSTTRKKENARRMRVVNERKYQSPNEKYGTCECVEDVNCLGRNRKKTLSKNNDADEKKLLPITLLENEDDVVIKHEGQSRGNRRAAKQGRHTSKFCLHPAGDTSSTCRLFDSIPRFCVPVIVSDGIELPFKDVIDYRKFYVFLRSDTALKPEFLVKRLRKVKPQKILKYQKAMKEVRRYFDYTHCNETMNEIWRQVTQKTPLIKLMINREKQMIKTELNKEQCSCLCSNNTVECAQNSWRIMNQVGRSCDNSCDKSEKPPLRAKFSTGTDELMMLALAPSWRVVFGLGGFGVRCKHSEEEVGFLFFLF
ncbi:unnamed protein product [Thlaspi arvense]|uniref:Exostosin GT47 domain-containing protein n=1 Tax=Thlaspi arvense TaxID=13288 RepID=A0AAU9SSX9_THLAR|nr:unnamed protein product [Thlaspi arvense]